MTILGRRLSSILDTWQAQRSFDFKSFDSILVADLSVVCKITPVNVKYMYGTKTVLVEMLKEADDRDKRPKS